MKILFFLFVFLPSIFFGKECHDYFSTKLEMKYATKLTIGTSDFGFFVVIEKPWIGSNQNYTYLFKKADANLPKECGKSETIISLPINKVIAISTTHVASMEQLDVLDRLVGFSNLKYINSAKVLQKVSEKKIAEIGYPPVLEKIAVLQPELILSYAAESPRVEGTEQLGKLGIPALHLGEYRETNPLGRAEWIKLYGVLFGVEEKAIQLFNLIESNYLMVKESVKNFKSPCILVGEKNGGAWYAPGGESDFATMIKDAGGDYLFKNSKGSDRQSLKLESVIKNVNRCDIWLTNNRWTRRFEIEASDSRYRQLGLLNLKIYNNNKIENANGGNDFWETGVVRPDLLLSDLAAIFHKKEKGEKLKWYQELE